MTYNYLALYSLQYQPRLAAQAPAGKNWPNSQLIEAHPCLVNKNVL